MLLPAHRPIREERDRLDVRHLLRVLALDHLGDGAVVEVAVDDDEVGGFVGDDRRCSDAVDVDERDLSKRCAFPCKCALLTLISALYDDAKIHGPTKTGQLGAERGSVDRPGLPLVSQVDVLQRIFVDDRDTASQDDVKPGENF